MQNPEPKYTISGLLRTAEEQVHEAKLAIDRGEVDGAERLQAWSEMLEGLRIMKERGVPDSLKDEAESIQ